MKKEIFVPKSKDSVKVYEQQNAINKNWKLERYFITKSYANDLKAFETHSGDILVSCAGTIGEMYELPNDSEVGVINQALMRVRVNENIISKKLYKLLFSNMIDEFSKEHSNGSAMKNIPPFADLKTMVAMVPSTNEQQKIGNYFENLDNLITLHQRKYDKLVNVKKSMLEKMFPRDNQNIPQIRFSGFTEAWEERKVEDVIEDYVEKTTIQNQYPVLTSSQQQGIVFQEDYFADRQVTTNDNIGYYVLPKGYFTYRSRSDTDIFVFNRNNLIDKGIISYYYPVFRAKSADSNFLLRRLNYGIKKQLSMAAEGTGQKVLAHSKFKSMIINVPQIDEQRKIGQIFEHIDHLIILHQREVEKLKNIKKSCLEKMFV
ncbi:MAG: restriction endonuclease subunit S [Clostridium paraputrificum]